MFSRHHYLNHSHHNSARTFIATLDDEICGFCSIMHLPNKDKRMKQGHRVVVLPDYQGIGIGVLLIQKVGDILLNDGFRFRFVTSNPAMIFSFKNNKSFKLCHIGRTSHHKGFKHMNKNSSNNRITTSWEYLKPK